MPWTAKRKYCESLPCPRRTKLYVETQVHNNYKQVEQTERKDLTVKAVCEESSHEAAARCKVRVVVRLYEELLSNKLKVMQSGANGACGSANVYMELAKLLLKQHEWIVTQRRFGSIPGIRVGDRFKYRAELLLVGLHRQFWSGIDYVVENGNMLATSIVHSSRYDNNISESFDALVYSGHGGNPMVKIGGVIKDQKLERGNLALKNNIRTETPVRVIYGSKLLQPGQQPIPIYTYVGLYSVEKFWQERGQHGRLVFKFGLRRMPGQPPLVAGMNNRWEEYETSKGNINLFEGKEKIPLQEENLFEWEEIPPKEVNLSEAKEKIPLQEVNLFEGKEKIPLQEMNLPEAKEKIPLGEVNLSEGNEKIPIRVVDEIDLSHGKEAIPIRVVNEIDNEQPPPFNYITHMVYPNLRNPSFPRGCNGVDQCYYENGRIVRFRPLIYECGPFCKCHCPNRVSQSGIRFQLEVFKSRPKSWGVRSRDYIPCGSFICEYIGEVFGENEVERKIGKEKYLFDIGCCDVDDNEIIDEFEGFTIDATHFGNVARFMDRSCDPNVWAQYVLYDHDDKRMPHVMLFAMKNIPPLQELTFSPVMR